MVRIMFQTRQKGIGLVEVLVALMIFSIGMLGIASLQIISKRSSFEAQQRQEAVFMANDMISRINNSGLTPSQIKTYYDGQDFSADSAPESPYDCMDNDCNVGQLVAYDLSRWHKNIYGSAVEAGSGKKVSGLVGTRGCIDVEQAGGEVSKVTVTIAWLSMSSMSGDKQRVCAAGDSAKQREVSVNTFIIKY